ncbi:MAG: tyrosine decarboxylase MfnA [Promethearchaeota archaeon]|jgi:tyrosine decarboxylase/aspartate 1-decarboxylase
MLEEGLKHQEILKILEEKLKNDYSYDSGSILGSMCTEPNDFGIEVYMKYISKNLGDPGLFSGTFKLEQELVSELGELFGGKNIKGTLTTGGSEANLIAMRIAKKLRPDIRNPEVILPNSAHVSFDKAADLLGIKLRKANLKDDFQLDLNHFESLINRNTCGVVGIAGTTSLGLVDPIKEMGDIIEDNEIFFHVDAAFGGFILPFLKYLNFQVPLWDFSVPSVDSITADPHKMGFGIIPTGGIFLRNHSILEKLGFEIPYLPGGNFKQLHVVGTRPGGTVIAFWAIIKSLGMRGFTEIIKKCMDNTAYLVEKLKEIKGVTVVTEPLMNVVGLTTDNGASICEIDRELRKKDWMTGKFEDFNLIRIVLMPHIQKVHLEKFCEDLENILKYLEIS